MTPLEINKGGFVPDSTPANLKFEQQSFRLAFSHSANRTCLSWMVNSFLVVLTDAKRRVSLNDAGRGPELR